MRLVVVTVLSLAAASGLAQSPRDSAARAVPQFVRGVVVAGNAPLSGADVFDVATLEGGATAANGAFAIAIRNPAAWPVHLAARKVGYRPAEAVITAPSDSVRITLQPIAALGTVSVVAGRFTANAERTAALTPVEVMTTPGGGDVNSTVKTLPGVQNVDEGSGVFVRGGDFTETRTFIDGAPMFTAYQFAAPTGSVAGTINPFLTDGLSFSAGGFGVQQGNTLSGIVDLRPQGRPQSTSASVNATLLSVGAGASARLEHGLGGSVTASASDLGLLLDVNGNPRRFAPAPHGTTFSGQGVWEYDRTGRVTVFALRQQSAMGIAVQDPAFPSTYRNNRLSDIVVASLRDTIGTWRPFISLSTSGLTRTDTQAVYHSRSAIRSWMAKAELAREWTSYATITVGAEDERLDAVFATRTPMVGSDIGPGAATALRSLDRGANRTAAYAQVELRPVSSVSVLAGLRGDRSGFATAPSTDPRVSLGWRVTSLLSLSASHGVYHQVVDPAFLTEVVSSASLPAARATMTIAGAQLGEGSQFVRVEAWRKRYADLAALTRNYVTVAGLRGRASGFDVFARGTGPLGTRLRLTWSAEWSRRDEPNTLRDAPPPFDVTHSVVGVIERDWSSGWHVGVAQRLATGKPYTDVQSATFDSTRGVYVPTYGPPDAQRLPDYRRADIAISRIRALSHSRFLVIFGAIQNPFNSRNLFGYTWTRDYAARVSVPSTVNRTFFIGANLTQGRNP